MQDFADKRFTVRMPIQIVDELDGTVELEIPIAWGGMPFDAKHFVVELALDHVIELARKLQQAGIETAIARNFPKERIEAMLQQLARTRRQQGSLDPSTPQPKR